MNYDVKTVQLRINKYRSSATKTRIVFEDLSGEPQTRFCGARSVSLAMDWLTVTKGASTPVEQQLSPLKVVIDLRENLTCGATLSQAEAEAYLLRPNMSAMVCAYSLSIKITAPFIIENTDSNIQRDSIARYITVIFEKPTAEGSWRLSTSAISDCSAPTAIDQDLSDLCNAVVRHFQTVPIKVLRKAMLTPQAMLEVQEVFAPPEVPEALYAVGWKVVLRGPAVIKFHEATTPNPPVYVEEERCMCIE